MSTIFEKIIAREIPAYIVYEDDLSIAFLDIMQATKGHTLVVPKKAYQSIHDIPEELLSHLVKVAKKIAKAIEKAFSISDVNLLNNSGVIAGQTVFHFHLHVIPRYVENDITMHFVNHMNELSPEEYKKRAALISTALL
ncbi:MAG: HIT family protein [Acholeplasmataceae bacterium]|nr:HIT family protein [Acholeplasmataceae bacterium]